MPAYSPELNPCELVFAQVKKIISALRGEGWGDIYDQVLLAFDEVTLVNIFNYYRKCLFPKEVLPELFKSH